MISLPIIDLLSLSCPDVSVTDYQALSAQLGRAFENIGFAYLINSPIIFNREAIFATAKDFFALPLKDMMTTAERSAQKNTKNPYRGCVVLTHC